jgi:hypothetical protein
MSVDLLLASVGHAPALMLFRRWRFGRGLLVANGIAMAVTLLAMVMVGVWSGTWAFFLAWAIGHVTWSVTLVTLMLMGRAGGPREES